ncbi:MAG: hypothetical protein HYV33_01600 [Candidatus Kerfeldbacteria bacterium]|nr:hypothetical protein [Candidatus Kerfeldbacteria bacterium]
MNPSKTMIISTLTASLLVLAGAGCTQPTTNENNISNANAVVVENTNDNTNTEQGSEVDTSDGVLRSPEGEADWLIYTNEEYGFSFRYPNNLKLTESSEKLGNDHEYIVLTFYENEIEYGEMRCPQVETGYEIWENWKDDSRTFQKDGKKYSLKLSTADAKENSGVTNIGLIFVKRSNIKNNEYDNFFEDTCQFFFKNVNEQKKQIIKSIYNSID